MTSCQQLTISVVAYGVTPQKVMVRVPNERGRWLMTDWCVVAVPCEACGAITGEPCHNDKPGLLRTYHCSTHFRRRNLGSERFGKDGYKHFSPFKIRVRDEDLRQGADQ